MLRQALTPKFDAAWEELPSAKVLQAWYKKTIRKCTAAIVGNAQASWLFRLMSRDLEWLPDTEWLEKLDNGFHNVIVPAKSLHANIQDEAEVGSTNLSELILLINLHRQLLMRYEVIRLSLFDSYDPALEKESKW